MESLREALELHLEDIPASKINKVERPVDFASIGFKRK